jgi:glycogen operon protein
MLTAGDEFGRSQFGNNNAYAQDNDRFWLDWAGADQELIAFVARLAALRRDHPLLRGESFLKGQLLDSSGRLDATWLRADGAPVADPDWRELDVFGLLLTGPDDAVLIAFNRRDEPAIFAPPDALAGRAWRQVFCSSSAGGAAQLPPRSVSLFAEIS